MEITEVKNRSDELIVKLLEIWESSVRATHTFLTDEAIENIKAYVPQALRGVCHLIVAKDKDTPVGFMGIEDGSLEMLFIVADNRGKGLGRDMLEFGIANYKLERLAVNEQNPKARGFYEHMGFRVYKRTDLDEQGNPYPLLYMRLTKD